MKPEAESLIKVVASQLPIGSVLNEVLFGARDAYRLNTVEELAEQLRQAIIDLQLRVEDVEEKLKNLSKRQKTALVLISNRQASDEGGVKNRVYARLILRVVDEKGDLEVDLLITLSRILSDLSIIEMKFLDKLFSYHNESGNSFKSTVSVDYVPILDLSEDEFHFGYELLQAKYLIFDRVIGGGNADGSTKKIDLAITNVGLKLMELTK